MKLNLLKPKRIFRVSLFSSAIFLSPLSSLALTVQEVPNLREKYDSWLTYMVGILSDKIETKINQITSQLKAKNSTEKAIVPVPETAPATSPKKFTTEVFNSCGIGKKEQNNNVLFLISVGDCQVGIETGYGVETILPDSKVGNIIDFQIKPRLKKGDFENGTLVQTKTLILVLKSDRALFANKVTTTNQVITPSQETSRNANTTLDNAILCGLLAASGIFVLVVGSAVYLGRSRKTFIKPKGCTRISKGNYIFLCADCQQPMKKVDETTVALYLNKPEKTAQNLGSVRFEGWRCPNCSHKLTDSGLHIIAHKSHSSRFRECPHCQELTITRTEKIIELATQYSSEKRLIIDNCHSCYYHHHSEEIISRLPPPPSPLQGQVFSVMQRRTDFDLTKVEEKNRRLHRAQWSKW
ncbi:MAG: TPM domain-containing protein [Fischerella sp. CENA71]|nr:TPM domain-containing protein [Fischerella sp. CENA71]